MNTKNIKITLTEEMLGTKAANKDVFADFIASKAPDGDARKQELENAEHIEEAGTTVFHRTDKGHLMIYDYQIKGFLKEGGDALRCCERLDADPETGKKPKKKWGSIKSKIDNFVFITPREIPFGPKTRKKPDGICERPLRCQTMQGPRVSVARSEVVTAGATIKFKISVMDNAPVTMEMIMDILEYGELKGLGQWRNSGKGRFEFEVTS